MTMVASKELQKRLEKEMQTTSKELQKDLKNK